MGTIQQKLGRKHKIINCNLAVDLNKVGGKRTREHRQDTEKSLLQGQELKKQIQFAWNPRFGDPTLLFRRGELKSNRAKFSLTATETLFATLSSLWIAHDISSIAIANSPATMTTPTNNCAQTLMAGSKLKLVSGSSSSV